MRDAGSGPAGSSGRPRFAESRPRGSSPPAGRMPWPPGHDRVQAAGHAGSLPAGNDRRRIGPPAPDRRQRSHRTAGHADPLPAGPTAIMPAGPPLPPTGRCHRPPDPPLPWPPASNMGPPGPPIPWPPAMTLGPPGPPIPPSPETAIIGPPTPGMPIRYLDRLHRRLHGGDAGRRCGRAASRTMSCRSPG